MLDILQEQNTKDKPIPFNQLDHKEFEPEIEKAIGLARTRVEEIESLQNPNFANTIEALELASKELDQITTIFFNLYHACTNENIDEQVASISKKLAEFNNDIQLSEKVFEKVKTVYEQKENFGLNEEQLKLLEETYSSFTRNGALLSDDEKSKLRGIDQKMASISPMYSQNILKATNAFSLNITDESKVTGLPDSILAMAKDEAENKEQSGWTFTLQAPSYIPFMKYIDDRDLRKQMWMAYNTRALNGEYSNRDLCKQIAILRNERAKLLGFPTHAHFVLQKRMAKTPEQVFQFLEELKKPSMTAAKKDIDQLQNFVENELGADIEIQPWDFAYYSDKLKKHLFDLNDEDLRPYFPLQAVVDGVFLHAEKLYKLNFKKNSEIPVYHPDVDVYEVHRDGNFIGLLYFDIFPRDNKKAGAWMTNYREQGFDGVSVKRPHVSIVCNFSKPSKDHPSLLTFNEVQTLFHEFGHSLHSLLSDVYYHSLSGTNVLWDFVELPSQLMENWTYEKESLDLFARHYKTGETIPAELVEKLQRSRNFQAGYASVRQISFSYVDLNWHTDLEGKNLDPIAMETEATKDLQLLPKVPETNFSVGFSHIFAGGYSAGYYSYKWAEVLDADAFEAFKEKGLFNQEVATRLYKEVLSQGGTKDPAVLYENFRGKKPDTTALLKRSGLA